MGLHSFFVARQLVLWLVNVFGTFKNVLKCYVFFNTLP